MHVLWLNTCFVAFLNGYFLTHPRLEVALGQRACFSQVAGPRAPAILPRSASLGCLPLPFPTLARAIRLLASSAIAHASLGRWSQQSLRFSPQHGVKQVEEDPGEPLPGPWLPITLSPPHTPNNGWKGGQKREPGAWLCEFPGLKVRVRFSEAVCLGGRNSPLQVC